MGLLDSIKAKKDSLIDAGATKVLDTFARTLINKYLEGILEFQSIKLENKRPVLSFMLAGVPNQVFTAEVGLFDISEDGKKVMFGNFKSNTLFVENALNKFAARTIDIDDDKAAAALAGVKKFLL